MAPIGTVAADRTPSTADSDGRDLPDERRHLAVVIGRCNRG
jgi:hypothetical protein